MKFIYPEMKRESAGHYSPGVVSNGTLYVSGQLPVDPDTGTMVTGGASEHAAAALRNVENVLKAAGLEKRNVVLCRVYVPDVALWAEVNAAYAEFFGEHKPARVVAPSRELYGGALVEIEAVAELAPAE